MTGNDPHDLRRFVDAQEAAYADALAELRAGRKRTHWIWFIFPQVAGLGFSRMSQRYAIQSRHEAEAYLSHSILGPRLTTCAQALLQLSGRTAYEVMGSPDDAKLRSSMTLFAAVAPLGSVFQDVLDRYYDGQADPQTLAFLRSRDTGA